MNIYFKYLALNLLTITALPNQNPEQLARDEIDKQLLACGWIIQHKNKINLSAGVGVAVREYQTDIGPADYVLFVNKQIVQEMESRLNVADKMEECINQSLQQAEALRQSILKKAFGGGWYKFKNLSPKYSKDSQSNLKYYL